MASHNLEQDLGELRGQLDALMPTLERMEERVHTAKVEAAAAEARNQGLRKEFDELKNKVSLRLQGIYSRLENSEKENNNRKNEIGSLKRDITDAVDEACGPLGIRVGELETIQAAIKDKAEGWKTKAWEVVKIMLAAGVGALVTWLLK